jgi:hypothetical protein
VLRDQLYLLFPPDVPWAEAVHYETGGAVCGTYRKMVACSTSFSRSLPAGFERLTPNIDYAMGDTIPFGKKAFEERYLGVGWSWPEGGHRWSLGDASFLYLRLAQPLPPRSVLRARTFGHMAPSRPPVITKVIVNGAPGGEIPGELYPGDHEVTLPEIAPDVRVLEIELRPSDYRSPTALGTAKDDRELGIAIIELSIAAAP